jgi:hypothetical protein
VIEGIDRACRTGCASACASGHRGIHPVVDITNYVLLGPASRCTRSTAPAQRRHPRAPRQDGESGALNEQTYTFTKDDC